MDWQRVWDRITSSEWVADTGVPLALQLLAILLAWIFLRKQLRSDRELLEASWAKDRELQEASWAKDHELQETAFRMDSAARVAADSAERAHALSLSILQLTNRLNPTAYHEHELSESELTSAYFPLTLQGNQMLSLDQFSVLWLWFGDLMTVSRISASLRDEFPDDRKRGEVATLVAGKYYMRLIAYANRLSVWDGEGPMPEMRVDPSEEHSNSPAWVDERRAELRAELARVYSKAGDATGSQ
ncbi:hypothetical protein [Nostocoides veronense]|uniref:Uncharacterized protein n=1 Tax=Nostocoides veronense TaxID=330836 RepID=A0ABN2LB72_9MICO